jgi:hypothetical protein
MYHVQYDPTSWLEAQQYILQDIDEDRRLIVHLFRTSAGTPKVVRAWIEQAYITRRDGWKWRIVEQLRPQAIALEPREALQESYAASIISNNVICDR